MADRPEVALGIHADQALTSREPGYGLIGQFVKDGQEGDFFRLEIGVGYILGKYGRTGAQKPLLSVLLLVVDTLKAGGRTVNLLHPSRVHTSLEERAQVAHIIVLAYLADHADLLAQPGSAQGGVGHRTPKDSLPTIKRGDDVVVSQVADYYQIEHCPPFQDLTDPFIHGHLLLICPQCAA
ncbi:MAG: hypothetical protein GTN71_20435 [Anaerolineae bacterium]|nr:hypothetical protein [Anaerolineae bacterium]